MKCITVVLILTFTFLSSFATRVIPTTPNVAKSVASSDLLTPKPTSVEKLPVPSTTRKIDRGSHSIILGQNRFIVRVRNRMCRRKCNYSTVKVILTTKTPPHHVSNHSQTVECCHLQRDNIYHLCAIIIVLLVFTLLLQCTTCFIPFLLRMLCQRHLSSRTVA